MKLLFLLIISVFASNEKETTAGNSEPKILENSILVKIEEDEYNKTNKPNYVGVTYNKQTEMWRAYRHSKAGNKLFYNGSYKDEKTAAHASDTLARKLIENGEEGHKLNFPDDNIEVYPEKRSNYIGVSYIKSKWCTWRWSKNEKKLLHNGTSYKDEETAAHASDTLARKLIANGEKGHKLNFPDDDTEVHPEKKICYIGVYYHKRKETWGAERWSKEKHRTVYHGASYKDEETAAHASDTLARKLIANGEKGHKINFPDDDTEVCLEKSSNYIGVSYIKPRATWRAQRYSKHESQNVYNGSTYNNEETAAHASDTVARKLIANGEKGHKLNFPDNDTEEIPKNYQNKRKRPAEFENAENPSTNSSEELGKNL